MALNLANGPKLNGPFVPLAVGAYTMAWVTMGGPFDGASMNPARSFGPDVALGHLSTWWVYLIGPAAGAVLAVGVAHVLRGPATAQEAAKAMGFPWSGADRDRHVRPPLASSWPNTPHRTRPDRPRTGWTIPSTTSTSHPGSANQPRRQDRAVGSVLVCALPAVYPAANATEAN